MSVAGARPAALSAEAVARVSDRLPALFATLDMPTAEFRHSPAAEQNLFDFLGVDRKEFPNNQSSNHASSMAALRTMFQAHPFIARRDAAMAKYILQQKLLCDLCFRVNQRQGILAMRGRTLAEHAAKYHGARTDDVGGGGGGGSGSGGDGGVGGGGGHGGASRDDDSGSASEGDAIAARAPKVKRPRNDTMRITKYAVPASQQQQAIAEVDVAVAALVAGADGAAGLPMTSIPRLFKRELLQLLSHIPGLPQPSTIITRSVPVTASAVMSSLGRLFTNRRLAIGIDGGNSTALKVPKKLVAVTVLDPEIGDFLLGIEAREAHETGESQAALITSLFQRRGLSLAQLDFVMGDNASLNETTVERLVSGGHTHVRRARCLSHSLALVNAAVVAAVEDAVGLQHFLRSLRSFVKAGGGVRRLAVLASAKLSLAQFDFVDTRLWTSLATCLGALFGHTEGESPATQRWNALYRAIDEMPADDRREWVASGWHV